MISASSAWYFAFSTLCCDAAFLQHIGQLLGVLDRNRTDKHRLFVRVAFDDFFDNGLELAVLRFVDDVRKSLRIFVRFVGT